MSILWDPKEPKMKHKKDETLSSFFGSLLEI